jgi:hypothetical protein
MMRWLLLAAGLSALVAVTGCGDYPEPFLGNPGGAAMQLRQPPDPRLAIPTPQTALLSDGASQQFAVALAQRLQQAEVPAYAQPASRTDWRLVVSAQDHGQNVVPIYTVLNPQGQPQGSVQGKPVETAAWAAATPGTLTQAAADAAPDIDSLLTSIEMGIMRADPNSLYNRVAKVEVPTVTGAPGDGDFALTKEMRDKLAALGPHVQTSEAGSDFVVQGQVRMVPIAGGQQRVEIQWIIKNAKAREVGRVIQLNNIPAGTLDHYWGDVAMVVAQQASGGVNEVIRRQSGHEPAQAEQPAAQTNTSTTSEPQPVGLSLPAPVR